MPGTLVSKALVGVVGGLLVTSAPHMIGASSPAVATRPPARAVAAPRIPTGPRLEVDTAISARPARMLAPIARTVPPAPVTAAASHPEAPPRPVPQPVVHPVPRSAPAPVTPTGYGCAAAVAYLQTHAAPGFVFECPGGALGHQAMTCINVAGVCPGQHLIAIADPCTAAYMNEAHNSWVLEGRLPGPIDPYGYCTG
jgi:hypothetical protein